MNNIFQTLVYQREKKKDTVLATIIWDDGSAPRGRGSQMLVGAEGLLAGTIGGGAVELKSIRLCQELLASGGSGFVREFRLSRDGELGMACGGDVTVLFSPARLDDARWDETAAEVLRQAEQAIREYQSAEDALAVQEIFRSKHLIPCTSPSARCCGTWRRNSKRRKEAFSWPY